MAIPVINRGDQRFSVSYSDRPGCTPDHCERGYEPGALGREAKRNAGSLLGSLRHSIPKASNEAEQAEAWAFFAYTLIDSDSSLYLAGLVDLKTIQRDVIPDEWTVWLTVGDVSLQESIRWARTGLAQHVLICTLPGALALPMSD